MHARGSRLGDWLRGSVPVVHALVLLAALIVPAYAAYDALKALLDPTDAAPRAALVDISRWGLLLRNTAIVCGVGLLVAATVGGGLGLLVTRTNLPGRGLLLAAALFGACVPVYVSLTFVFSAIPLISAMNSAVACGLLYGLVYTPLALLVLGATFWSADRELEEAALLDATPTRVLWRVTLPAAAWGFIVLAVVLVLLIVTDSTIGDLLGVRTFAEEVRSQYALAGRRAGPLLTGLPVLLVLAALLVAAQARYRLVGEQTPWQFGARPRVFSLGRWRWVLALTLAACLLAGLGTLAWALARHLTPWELVTAAAWDLRGELGLSALLAVAGATAAVLPASGLAWGLARGGRRGWVAGAAVVVLLAVPAPVAAISLIGLLNRPGWPGAVYDSAAIVVLGYFVRFLPVAVLLLVPGVRRVPRDAERAARVDGCDWSREHWHVRLPALLPDVALAWLVLVIFSFAELGATLLLAPPGVTVAAVRAFTLLHFGVYRDVAVLAVLSVGLIVVPWALLMLLLWRGHWRRLREGA